MANRTAIIIGAGPAGLTAAYELLKRTDIRPIVLELGDYVGGISRTVVYKGNRMDLGGHRFFSKSDRVMKWWADILPIAGPGEETRRDDVMLVRDRRSRILYGGRFYDYPIRLSGSTLANLGMIRTARIGASYLKSRVTQRRPERTLEDFLVNRFGGELYRTFFESYTEKVWGVPCREISAEWGAQRIKGLSLSGAVRNAVAKLFARDTSLAQKGTETSLIERFLYPKYGPGQLWEAVEQRIQQAGGEVRRRHRVVGVCLDGGRVMAVDAAGPEGAVERLSADFCFSTMPISELVTCLGDAVPAAVRETSRGLMYRSFLTAGVLLRRLASLPGGDRERITDNWIYVQEPHVRMGRIQIFNNWSPYLVRDPDTAWLGLEYFCGEGDTFWGQTDRQILDLAATELAEVGLCAPADILDGTVVRVPKAYPAYFGTYHRIGEVRAYLDAIPNLYLIGRNGMHRYNNQDHSMLTGMVAVDNIAAGVSAKDAIWQVNAEDEYHEQR